MRGGYKIVDLEFKNISNNGRATTVDGIYDAIEGNYYKPTLLHGLVVDNVERADRYVEFGISTDNFVAEITLDGGKTLSTLTVTKTNEVTLANKA